MCKYLSVLCVALYCANATATELQNDKNWFIMLGANAYSKNRVHYNIADTIWGGKSINDNNCGYGVSVGYAWGWIATELALNRIAMDNADAVVITGRITMPIFPLENMPYIGVEYGGVAAEYYNSEYDVRIHDETTTFGLLLGVRYEITESFFINALWQYNRLRMSTDVYDVPIKLNVRRQNVSLAIGWRF